MTTPAVRAGVVCGALAGGCSAMVSAAAHTAAGGALPGGAAIAMFMLVCATIGATTGARAGTARVPGTAALIAGLGTGQVLSHIALVAASHHRGHALLPSGRMLLAHVAATIALALLIRLVGHFAVVCATLLSWLSLTCVHRGRPAGRPWGAPPAVVLSLLLGFGLRLRAPPRMVPSLG